MDHLKIALLQIAPGGTQEANLQKGLDACRKAREKGADIALFPEMWSNGYGIDGLPASQWTAQAVPADGRFVQAFGALANELDMAARATVWLSLTGRAGAGCSMPRCTPVISARNAR